MFGSSPSHSRTANGKGSTNNDSVHPCAIAGQARAHCIAIAKRAVRLNCDLTPHEPPSVISCPQPIEASISAELPSALSASRPRPLSCLELSPGGRPKAAMHKGPCQLAGAVMRSVALGQAADARASGRGSGESSS
jgi:hypothetical protein